MKNLIKNIENIIIQNHSKINDKISGINFLEKLKYIIIDDIKSDKINLFKDLNKTNVNKITNKFNDNNLDIIIEYSSDLSTKLKYSLPQDYMSIVLMGFKSIDIYESMESKISKSLNLFSENGIVLSKNTIISESISKQSIVLNIHNFRENSDIEI